MVATTWYDLFPHRLVLETIRVNSYDQSFVLKRLGTTLYWEGKALEIPEGIDAPPLHFVVVYPEAFPAVAPSVEVISPELSPTDWGHTWHRWWNGNVCYVRPSKWQVSTTAEEIIKKIEDWYFNYTAEKQGLIAKMPDMGRAEIPARRIAERGASV